jgi:hypothetical protein
MIVVVCSLFGGSRGYLRKGYGRYDAEWEVGGLKKGNNARKMFVSGATKK